MPKKPVKAKVKAANYVVPQNREECDDMIRQLGDLRRDLARVEADMNDKLAKVKESFELKAEPLREKCEELVQGIETYCAANRQTLTQEGKVKFATFGNGEVKWRIRPPKVTARRLDHILEQLRGLGLKRFIRSKDELNKEAVLNEPDAVATIKGLNIGSEGEDFVVEPFEAELKKAS